MPRSGATVMVRYLTAPACRLRPLRPHARRYNANGFWGLVFDCPSSVDAVVRYRCVVMGNSGEGGKSVGYASTTLWREEYLCTSLGKRKP